MADLEKIKEFFKGKNVLVTGHTGFKGSWLSYWLSLMGSNVIGYALPPDTLPSHFNLLKLAEKITSYFGDIRSDEINKVIKEVNPDIVFHLAAQPLVRRSYKEPFLTYSVNVMGTLKLLEAIRNYSPITKAVVIITSDKVYENNEWLYPYREEDKLGGYDMYSSSKATVEILCSSYRRSFWNLEEYGVSHSILMATARAGNVIGGGDWAEDRIIPDMIRAAVSGAKVLIRSPMSVRPWQHVLEPLWGYIVLAYFLYNGKKTFASSWNFGPDISSSVTVKRLVDLSSDIWNKIVPEYLSNYSSLHEAKTLRLDATKARLLLNWNPVWDIERTVKKTIEWYKSFYDNKNILTRKNIEEYEINLNR